MNRIARIAALLVALTAVFSFSQENPSMPTEKPIVYDTEKPVVYDTKKSIAYDTEKPIAHNTEKPVVYDTEKPTVYDKYIEAISEIVIIKLLEKSQEVYASNFNQLQNSFDIFLAMIGILVAISIGLSIYHNIEGEKKLKKQIKYQKNEFEKIKTELENEKKLLEKNRKDIYGEIEYTYFSLAISSFKMKDYKEHFMMLADHFATFRKRKIEPEYIDLKRLTRFDNFIKEYGGDKIEIATVFLYELYEFIKYGEETYKNVNSIGSIFLEDIKEIRQKIYDKFGGEDKVLEAIKNFKSHL